MRAQIACAIGIAALVACDRGQDSLTSEGVSAYLDQVGRWAPQEAEVGRAVKRILETQLVDEVEVRRQLGEAKPRVELQVASMAQYPVPPGPLRTVHAAYVDAWRSLDAALSDLERGLDAGDHAMLGRGRQGLIAWREALLTTAKRLGALTGPQMERGPPS